MPHQPKILMMSCSITLYDKGNSTMRSTYYYFDKIYCNLLKSYIDLQPAVVTQISGAIFNPFTPMSDQDRISPYSISTISSRPVNSKEKNQLGD